MNNYTTINEHYLYVVFSMTNTNVGKVIRFFTRNKFNHVSLSLHEDLRVMYSFARLHKNSPLVGGFVLEHPNLFMLDRKDVYVKICRIPVTKEKHNEINKTIIDFSNRKEEMIYNSFSAVSSLFHKKIPIKNAYTCLEFVSTVLNMEEVSSIKDLEMKLNKYKIYSGSLKNIAFYDELSEDEFFQRQDLYSILVGSIRHFGNLLSRGQFRNK